MSHASLIERLMAENEEFRRLRQEHQRYDQELEALKQQTPLSAEQQWRMTELKKLKLMAKDRMELILRQSRVTA
ncbi:MAG TPA: YdcH family protein [Calidithermus sp.]|nr:YdcH family protein [Calidithermus sp.]